MLVKFFFYLSNDWIPCFYKTIRLHSIDINFIFYNAIEYLLTILVDFIISFCILKFMTQLILHNTFIHTFFDYLLYKLLITYVAKGLIQ